MIAATIAHMAYSSVRSTRLPTVTIAKHTPKVTYPSTTTSGASEASGIRPSSSAVEAVALASAQPGQPY